MAYYHNPSDYQRFGGPPGAQDPEARAMNTWRNQFGGGRRYGGGFGGFGGGLGSFGGGFGGFGGFGGGRGYRMPHFGGGELGAAGFGLGSLFGGLIAGAARPAYGPPPGYGGPRGYAEGYDGAPPAYAAPRPEYIERAPRAEAPEPDLRFEPEAPAPRERPAPRHAPEADHGKPPPANFQRRGPIAVQPVLQGSVGTYKGSQVFEYDPNERQQPSENVARLQAAMERYAHATRRDVPNGREASFTLSRTGENDTITKVNAAFIKQELGIGQQVSASQLAAAIDRASDKVFAKEWGGGKAGKHPRLEVSEAPDGEAVAPTPRGKAGRAPAAKARD